MDNLAPPSKAGSGYNKQGCNFEDWDSPRYVTVIKFLVVS